MENLERLVIELCKLPNETQWVEFKSNNYDPHMIGQDISALANSAALHGRVRSYMIWGVDDETHQIIGTDKNLQNIKKGNQELESWLRQLLSKNSDFEFHNISIEGKNVAILIIYKALNTPVTFEKIDYIRIGSYTKKLNEFPALQSQLWDKIRNDRFEEQYVAIDLTAEDAVRKLDYNVYFENTHNPLPSDLCGVAHYMQEEDIIVKQDNGLFSITNLGAISFAKNLNEFTTVSRKALRIVQYDGNNRLNILKETTRLKGYASDFENSLQFIMALLPSRQPIINGIRTVQNAFPEVVVREILANALIHQDFSVTGAGPTIEIFNNRIEVINPGVPVVDINRIIDTPPKSRNEKLASLLRRLRFCEELGTGWDKVILECESHNLPAPAIELYGESNTKVTVFSFRSFSDLTPEEKLWSCYLHCCIKHAQNEFLTNKSLRERFGLESSGSSAISRLINLAIENKLIKPVDPAASSRYMKYQPYWS